MHAAARSTLCVTVGSKRVKHGAPAVEDEGRTITLWDVEHKPRVLNTVRFDDDALRAVPGAQRLSHRCSRVTAAFVTVEDEGEVLVVLAKVKSYTGVATTAPVEDVATTAPVEDVGAGSSTPLVQADSDVSDAAWPSSSASTGVDSGDGGPDEPTVSGGASASPTPPSLSPPPPPLLLSTPVGAGGSSPAAATASTEESARVGVEAEPQDSRDLGKGVGVLLVYNVYPTSGSALLKTSIVTTDPICVCTATDGSALFVVSRQVKSDEDSTVEGESAHPAGMSGTPRTSKDDSPRSVNTSTRAGLTARAAHLDGHHDDDDDDDDDGGCLAAERFESCAMASASKSATTADSDTATSALPPRSSYTYAITKYMVTGTPELPSLSVAATAVADNAVVSVLSAYDDVTDRRMVVVVDVTGTVTVFGGERLEVMCTVPPTLDHPTRALCARHSGVLVATEAGRVVELPFADIPGVGGTDTGEGHLSPSPSFVAKVKFISAFSLVSIPLIPPPPCSFIYLSFFLFLLSMSSSSLHHAHVMCTSF